MVFRLMNAMDGIKHKLRTVQSWVLFARVEVSQILRFTVPHYFYHLYVTIAAFFKKNRQTLIYGCAIVLLLLVTILLWPMDKHYYIRTKPSGELLDRHGRLLYPTLNIDQNWCFERGLDQISRKLIVATLATEDQRFYYHPGIDPIAILRAVWQNLTQRKVVSGASTLTMQAVKNQTAGKNTISEKVMQAIQALRLNFRATKDQVLWAYLNNAPYGANLIGCEAASRRYFGKPCIELSLAEAALLAGLPKAPGYFNPLRYPVRAKKRRDFVLLRMWQEGFISKADYKNTVREPVDARWLEFPKLAPHLAVMYKEPLNKGQKIVSTINYQVQINTEGLLKRAVRRMHGEVTNAATMILDVSTGELLARAGSADFWNEKNDGQVDVCQATRSPGSTLKPFIYAEAMEKNRLYSTEILLDDTWDIGLYNPENFDQSFKGLISASLALKTSRNVPAITVLERIGLSGFLQFMQALHINTLKYAPEHYGLGIILGNCEVKLEELIAAYTMLATLGEYRPIRYTMNQPIFPSKRILSQGTCLKLYDMLELPLPDDLFLGSNNRINTNPRVCWKTGTSQGYRDAWTFMFNRNYAVGVWLGNNDGSPSKICVGAQIALPLAADLFLSLPAVNESSWPNLPNELQEIRICSRSGLPASDWCQHTQTEYFPINQFINRKCDMHYPKNQKEDPTIAEATVIERWPAAPQGWDLANIEYPFVSSQKRNREARSKELKILSPSEQSEYILTGERNADRIQLKSSLDQEGSVYWYLGEKYLGMAAANQPLFMTLHEGEQQLSCMTADGQVSTIRFKVWLPEDALRLPSGS